MKIHVLFSIIVTMACVAEPTDFASPVERKAWASALGTVSATTSTQRNPTSITRDAGTYSKSESHQTGVSVHFGPVSLKAVQSPYEVQCFFLAGGGGDLASRIHDQYRQVSDLPVDADFMSRPLAGKSSTYTSSAVELQSTTSNRTYTGTISSFSESEGSKSGGWIVRVLVANRVARVEASSAALKDYAAKNPAVFDAKIARVKASPPAPGKKPATGFGNTLLDRR